MVSEALKSFRYLIIAGTTKAATTSLFFYLKEHPQVCVANWKEARFFLDNEYPLKSKYRFEDGLENYANFYSHCTGNKLRVEATPDYLYSTGTPRKIKDALPHSRVLFMLREPVSRLISWYRFAKQNGDIPQGMPFDEYVRLQRLVDGQPGRPQHMLALEQGCYAHFLQPYFEMFERNRLYVVFYEEFRDALPDVLADICSFASIDPQFFREFDGKVYNKTETLRLPLVHKAYLGMRFHVRKFTYNRPLLHGGIRKLRQLFEPVYLRLNTMPGEKSVVSPSTTRFLNDYYAEERSSLKKLLGRQVPWK